MGLRRLVRINSTFFYSLGQFYNIWHVLIRLCMYIGCPGHGQFAYVIKKIFLLCGWYTYISHLDDLPFRNLSIQHQLTGQSGSVADKVLSLFSSLNKFISRSIRQGFHFKLNGGRNDHLVTSNTAFSTESLAYWNTSKTDCPKCYSDLRISCCDHEWTKTIYLFLLQFWLCI